jgi:hypothetical protein
MVAAAIGGVCEERQREVVETREEMVREKGQILGNRRGWVVLTRGMRADEGEYRLESHKWLCGLW